MLVNAGLHTRAAFLQAIRAFFYEQGFLEVDTPVRSPVLIPESTIEPISCGDFFLQTSPELYMKRILAAGNEKIFQICPCFRKGERGRLHAEEFTMLEWYRLDEDYHALMADCQQLVSYLAEALQAHTSELGRIDRAYLNGSWQRLTVAEAFALWSPIELKQAMADDIFEEMLVEYIEPRLGIDSPTFLYDYPASMASLARLSASNSEVAERFELYMHGIELANGFSELTDEVEQEMRFKEELAAIKREGRWQATLPVKFLQELAGLDKATGIALGLDRLLMLFLGKESIAEVVSFAEVDF
ncbi:EF-P lysine aminoacylase EpmA [Desulfotalea psychrophila]|uniref:Probable lysyl-tRNA synthetase n=1 Tax=Desulfotalea psychrophila (strain LSv54 / DSM 12343) TaxID=177439 RepID=Q6APZ8_DESPS|nr:EF-P lysine aminoacylase EpmA [Desulfotalea psychrophila]CAG35575.1 probable lysyl-tRNA synthetase [Desulfotalea psychrophila LSv54]